MGLRSTGISAINAAFNAAGDAATLVTYRRITQGAYNPATDSQAETIADTELKIIYGANPRANDFGNTNLDIGFTGQLTGIIKAAELLPDTPKTEDLIIDGTETYRVKGIEKIGPFSEAIGYELTLVKHSG